MTTENNLLLEKVQEAEKYPGLLLGLDGWILRSLPKALRGQFLQGYEKVLRIAFHPDRYPDEQQKQSRQRYLQAVSETVRFMSSSEMSFDLLSDAVPTRKNPMFALQEAVAVRDKIIKRQDEIINTRAVKDHGLRERAMNLQAQMEEISAAADNRSMAYHQMTIMTRRVTKTPVSIRHSRYQMLGAFVTFYSTGEIIKWLAEFSSVSNLSAEHRWLKGEWQDDARKEGMLGPPTGFVCRKTQMKASTGENYTILGAMTLGHLCEYIRYTTGYSRKLLSQEKTLNALKGLCATGNGQEYLSDFRSRMFRFSLPFFNSGMLLLTARRLPGSSWIGFRLFHVMEVDAENNPERAEILGLQRELKMLQRRLKRVSVQSRKRHG